MAESLENEGKRSSHHSASLIALSVMASVSLRQTRSGLMMKTLSRSGRGCLDMAPGPPSGLEIVFRVWAETYISRQLPYIVLGKSRSPSYSLLHHRLLPPSFLSIALIKAEERLLVDTSWMSWFERPAIGIRVLSKISIALGYVSMPEFGLAVIGRKPL